jgi:alpha-tubulin suppressor-like RCC1 family protein
MTGAAFLVLAAMAAGSASAQSSSDTLRFVYVDAGGRNSCGLMADGAAYCWGANDFGQLGVGRSSTEPAHLPTKVQGDHGFTSLAVGGRFTCALDPQGQAWCWGQNQDGQLGNGTTTSALQPVAVAGGLRFESIVAARDHACGLTSAGAAYCWGGNDDAQIGDGQPRQRGSYRAEPVAVAGDIDFSALADGGWDSTCGLAESGQIYCWGGVDLLEWGANPTSTPIVVSGETRFWALANGSEHLCGLRDDLALCWGENRSGQLGDGSNERRTAPSAVRTDSIFIRISAGAQHTCGLTIPGQVFCWGANGSGQLGTGVGSYANQGWNTPQPVAGGLSFRVVTAGDNHTCAMTATGEVYCWGDNRSGQLGSGAVGVGTVNAPVLVGP